MKKQVVIIHGGDTFESYEKYLEFLRNYEIDIARYKTSKDDWKPWLRDKLGDNYEVIIPVMPNKTNAQFSEWKLCFEKLTPSQAKIRVFQDKKHINQEEFFDLLEDIKGL